MRKITHRQMRAVEIWVRDGCKSKARALREAGYGKSVVNQPHKVFRSLVVLGELAKRGLDAYGIRRQMRATNLDEVRLPEIKPEAKIDFSKVPREWLQDLKERLAEIPDVPLRPI